MKTAATASLPCPHFVIVGLGCIGQAALPLLERAYPQAAISVVDRVLDAPRQRIVARHRLRAREITITPDNYAAVLEPWLDRGAALLNLAPSVCSLDLIALAQAREARYIDSGIEPWDYATGSQAAPLSNHALRQAMLAFARGRETMPTALVAHGANPGFVSALVKSALLKLARRAGIAHAAPTARAGWAALARALDIRVIQIAEYDSQRAPGFPRAGEFAGTWSVQGFIAECLQDAELGWGSHETALPPGARRQGAAAIALDRPGHQARVRSWSPGHGPFDAWLITHNESLSLADYLSDGVYRPTVYYAYRPCPATQASMALLDGRSAARVRRERILRDEIQDGEDELGVLLMSGRHGAIWHGSRLSVQRARTLAPYNSATSLQVAASLVAGLQWMDTHPARGVLESEALDWQFLFDHAAHWWAPLCEAYTDWQPRAGSGLAFGDFRVDDIPSPRLEAA
ncbi:MAG: saccharopine dehydrogenase NADP-binding domain-containing protein [Desulfobulbus sp.]|nr:saccharopine dehydrogenase NADP-binding domain-containing protein [Desulfobulbus sp.]